MTLPGASSWELAAPRKPKPSIHGIAQRGVGMHANTNRNSTQPDVAKPAIALFAVVAALTAAGCSSATSAPKPAPPLTVEVADVVQKDVPVYREWIGTLDGSVNADIKAQVSGYLIQQAYTEG